MYVQYVIKNVKNKQKEWHPATKPSNLKTEKPQIKLLIKNSISELIITQLSRTHRTKTRIEDHVVLLSLEQAHTPYSSES
jgi:hypothetical protein